MLISISPGARKVRVPCVYVRGAGVGPARVDGHGAISGCCSSGQAEPTAGLARSVLRNRSLARALPVRVLLLLRQAPALRRLAGLGRHAWLGLPPARLECSPDALECELTIPQLRTMLGGH